MQATPAADTAAAHSRARGTDMSTGFSQKMCLPAAAERVIRSLWVSVEDAIATTSIDLSASTASIVDTFAPSCCARSAAAGAIGSQTYCNVTPGNAARLEAWMRPMRPAPKRATFFMVLPAGVALDYTGGAGEKVLPSPGAYRSSVW